MKWFITGACFLSLMLIAGNLRHDYSQSSGHSTTQIEVAAQGTTNHPNRAPVWAFLNNRLFLLWRGRAVDKGLPRAKYLYGNYSIPFGYALKTADGWKMDSRSFEVPIGESTALDYCAVNGGLAPLFITQRFYDRRYGTDACIRHIQADAENKITISSKPLSILPFDSRDPEYLRLLALYAKQSQEDAAKTGHKAVFVNDKEAEKTIVPGDIAIDPERVPIKADFSRFSAVRTDKGAIWLTGIDLVLAGAGMPQKYMWVIASDDGGKSWGARNMIGRGNFPQIIALPEELQVYYVAVNQYGSLRQWSDDAYLKNDPYSRNWPWRDALMMVRSNDDGKTWSAPKKVLDDKKIIQCRACVAPDGKIWMVYVQSNPDPEKRRTSLWLTSSSDNGSTWAKPSPLTDGKYLDREPDITYQDGKILIAFSRAGRGITTNICTTEIDAS